MNKEEYKRAFDFLEKKSDIIVNNVNRAHISISLVCLVLDNIFPDEQWKENRDNILKVYEDFKKRDSFIETITQ